MKNLQIYDWAMPAGGSFQLPVEGAYVRILTATGNVNIIGDTFGKLGPVNRGQGLENTPYRRLVIQDASGAPNSGTVLVSEANFIDQTLYGSITLGSAVALDAATLLALEQINLRPEAETGNYKSTAAAVGGTAEQIFSAAANINGAILLSGGISTLSSVGIVYPSFLAKATAPISVTDGSVVFSAPCFGFMNTFYAEGGVVPNTEFIPAGLGLYFITANNSALANRSARYKLL